MGTRSELSGLDVDLAARYALYETHRFCIRLPAEASLLDETGSQRAELDPNTLGTFVHEYTHFTHNVSTLAGFAAYELMLHLLGCFSRALDNTGVCTPERLTPTLREDAATAARALFLLEGARNPPPHPSAPVRLRVLSIAARTEQNGGIEIPCRDVRWEITRRDTSIDHADLLAGAFLIEEGIAYLLENAVRRGRLAFDETWSLESGPPLFPYVAYQTLCVALASNISPLAAIRIGLLALNFNRPGEALIRTLNHYKLLRDQGYDDPTACERLRVLIHPGLAEMSERARTENLVAVPPLFKDRGLLQDGIQQVQRWFSAGLAAREKDNWFDLGWCSGASPDPVALSKMLRTSTPCDVIQERYGPDSVPARDALISFSESRKDPHDRTLGGVRALQAQFDFMLGHLTTTGLVGTAQGGGRRCCPFFSVCVLQMRRNDPDTCAHHPWVLWNRNPTCWYGAAVAGTLGKVVRVEESGEPKLEP
jgi:hypothetical protein